MFTLIRTLSTRDLLLQQAPAFAASFAIAEVLYKFHSFALECLAFLATWYVLDGAADLARSGFRKWRDS